MFLHIMDSVLIDPVDVKEIIADEDDLTGVQYCCTPLRDAI